MIYSIRSIALLMLGAGICLGVFGGTLFANKQAPTPVLDGMVEEQIKLYRSYFGVDQTQADQIRHELQRYRRAVRDEILRLRVLHADKFTELKNAATDRIGAILEGSGR